MDDPSIHLALRELLLASGLFDPSFYLEANPDVAQAGIDPITHYLNWGASEGRRPDLCIDGEWYRRKYPDVGMANPLVHYLRIGKAQGRRIHKRAVVYTVITEGYDWLRPPVFHDPDLDYIAFINEAAEVPYPWTRARIPKTFSDSRATVRYIKTHPHEHLKGYELTLWTDAAFQLRTLTADALDQLIGPASIACFQHPWRNCAYQEADTILQLNLDAPERVAASIRRLKAAGYPREAGLVECGFMIRRLNSASVRSAMEDWWQMILHCCWRDQLSLNFILWTHRIPYARIPGFSRRNRWAYWMGHAPANMRQSRVLLQNLEREILELQAKIEKMEDENELQQPRVR